MSANRLLVIDDEPDVAAVVGRIARQSGFDTIITMDAEDFLTRAEQWHPTVISLDLTMPDISPHKLLTDLAKRGCQAEILIVSGQQRQAVEEVRIHGLECGLNMGGVLLKPVRAADLREALRVIYDDAGMISASDLTEGLNSYQFFLEYQPKIDFRTSRATGVEALARWRHPKRGTVSPEQFIPVMEKCTAILDFTRWTIEAAIEQIGQWQENGLQLDVAVNVSGQACGVLELDAIIRAACEQNSVDPRKITVEITETAAMVDEIRAVACMHRLKEMGVHLSIDDFGTGVSSLIKLHRLPFSEIKIDKSFVMDCLENHESWIIVSTIIELAHNLDKKVVAEGVESERVLKHLTSLGCDAGQGYFISHPLSAWRLSEWVHEWNQTVGQSSMRLMIA